MNERGALTLDFIFALVMISGVTAIMIALCFTFAMVEVAQYIAFSSSRSYFGAHVTKEEQASLAQAKFDTLKAQFPIFKNGWFSLTMDENHDFQDEYGADTKHEAFVGTRLLFTASVLDFEIPFFGATTGEDTPKGFNAKINSFLGREPTYKECMEFVRERWNGIKRIDSRYSEARGDAYVVIADNGC